jgi:hypothetical protein
VQVTDTGSSSIRSEGFKDGNITGNDYTYDGNGNMIEDDNKGITNIAYNHLNLPTQVDIGGSKIEYVYDATGEKLRKMVQEGRHSFSTMYAGNYVYEGTPWNEELQFFNHPEGYVQYNNATFSYVYQYKDHLGNIRLSYADANNNPTTSISCILNAASFMVRC